MLATTQTNVEVTAPWNTRVGESGHMSGVEAVNMWVNEQADYDYSSKTCASGKHRGHYTQIVWKNSVRKGCAKVRCDYDPQGTKLNPIKTHHKKEIRPKENHKTRLSYIYISVEDSREFPSRVDEITQSNLRQTSGFMVFYGEIEYEEEEANNVSSGSVRFCTICVDFYNGIRKMQCYGLHLLYDYANQLAVGSCSLEPSSGPYGENLAMGAETCQQLRLLRCG
ncbi:hypothetical protein IGI04_013721 [Brassica rapa subsp. trilocularis]|uniref:SCP domain-containing protein n=1 Tax=Brassica rapa subsp. trilocularis TaxID=1813537 RepID=A0ABQ7N9M9_BRACM|nr:hypothetical protein IGI04_013721 [Brassica rapa subsp. trilocularis]